jgi:hypothetical protein
MSANPAAGSEALGLGLAWIRKLSFAKAQRSCSRWAGFMEPSRTAGSTCAAMENGPSLSDRLPKAPSEPCPAVPSYEEEEEEEEEEEKQGFGPAR